MMETLTQFIVSVFGITALMVLGIVWMGINYSKQKRGLTKAASSRELEELRREMSAIREDIHAIRESLADVTLMLSDTPQYALPKDRQEK